MSFLLGLYIIGIGLTFVLVHSSPSQPVYEAAICLCWPLALAGAMLISSEDYDHG